MKDVIFNDSLVRASHVELLQDNVWEVEVFTASRFLKVSCHLSCVRNILPVMPKAFMSDLLTVMNEKSQALVLRVDYCTYGVIHGTEVLTSLFGDILFFSCRSNSSTTQTKEKKKWFSLQEALVRRHLAYPSRPTIFRWKPLCGLSRDMEKVFFPEASTNRKLFHARARCVVLDVIRGDTFVVQWEPRTSSSAMTTANEMLSASSVSSLPPDDGATSQREPYPPVLVLRMTPCEHHQEPLIGMTVTELLALRWARRYMGQTLQVDIHTVSRSDRDVACNPYANQLDRRGAVEGLARGEDGKDIGELLLRYRLATLREVPFPFFPLYLDSFDTVSQLVLDSISSQEIEVGKGKSQLTQENNREEEQDDPDDVEVKCTTDECDGLSPIPFTIEENSALKVEEVSKTTTEWMIRAHKDVRDGEEMINAILRMIQHHTKLKSGTLWQLITFLGKEWLRSRCRGSDSALTRKLFHEYVYMGNYKQVDTAKLLCLFRPLRLICPMHKLPQLRVPLRGRIKQVLFHFDASCHGSSLQDAWKAEVEHSPFAAPTSLSLYVQLDVEIMEPRWRWDNYRRMMRVPEGVTEFEWTPESRSKSWWNEVTPCVRYVGSHTREVKLFVHEKVCPFSSSFCLSDHHVNEEDYKEVKPVVDSSFFSLKYTFEKYVADAKGEKVVVLDAFATYEEKDVQEVTEMSPSVEKMENEKRSIHKVHSRVFYFLFNNIDNIEEEEEGYELYDLEKLEKRRIKDQEDQESEGEDKKEEVEAMPVREGDTEKTSLEAYLSPYKEMQLYLSTIPFFFRLEFPDSCHRDSILNGEVLRRHLQKWMSCEVLCLPIELTRVHGILGFVGNLYFLSTDKPPSLSSVVGVTSDVVTSSISIDSFTTTAAAFRHAKELLLSSTEDIYDALDSCFTKPSVNVEHGKDMKEVREEASRVRKQLLRDGHFSVLTSPPPLRLLGRGSAREGSPRRDRSTHKEDEVTGDAIHPYTTFATALSSPIPGKPEEVSSSMRHRLSVESSARVMEWVDAQSPDYCPPTIASYIFPSTLPLVAFSLMARGLVGENKSKAKAIMSGGKNHLASHPDFYLWTHVRFPALPNVFESHFDQFPLAMKNVERRYCSYLIRSPFAKREKEEEEAMEISTHRHSHSDVLPDTKEERKVGRRVDSDLYAGERAFSALMTCFFHLRSGVLRYLEEEESPRLINEYSIIPGIPKLLFDPEKLTLTFRTRVVLYRVPIATLCSSTSYSWRLFLGTHDGYSSDVLEMPSPETNGCDMTLLSTSWMRKLASLLAFDTFTSPPALSTVPVELSKDEERVSEQEQIGAFSKDDKETVSTTVRLTPPLRDTSRKMSSSPSSPYRVHLRRVEGYNADREERKQGKTIEVLLATPASSRQVSGMSDVGYHRRLRSRNVLYHPVSWLHILGNPLMKREELRDLVDIEGTSQLVQEKGVYVSPEKGDEVGYTHPGDSPCLNAHSDKVKATQYIGLSYMVCGLDLKKTYKSSSFNRFPKKFIHLLLMKRWQRMGFIRDWCSLLLRRSTPYVCTSFSTSPLPMVSAKSDHTGEGDGSMTTGCPATAASQPSCAMTAQLDESTGSMKHTVTPIAATGMLYVFGTITEGMSAFYSSKRQLRRSELMPMEEHTPPAYYTVEEEARQDEKDLTDLARPIHSLLEAIDDAFLHIPCSRFMLTVVNSTPALLDPPYMTVTVQPIKEDNVSSQALIELDDAFQEEEYSVFETAVHSEEDESTEVLCNDAGMNTQSENTAADGKGPKTETLSPTPERNGFSFRVKNPHRPFDVRASDKSTEVSWNVFYDIRNGFVVKRVL